MHLTKMGPFLCLDNVSKRCNCGDYVFKMNVTKSIFCEKVRSDDDPFFNNDNNPVVDKIVVKRVMFPNLDGPTKTRMQVQVAHNKENENTQS